MNDVTYTIAPFPPFRQLVLDAMEIASWKHLIHGMVEVVNRKSVREVHQEIRQAQSQSLDETALGRNLRWYVLVPPLIHRSLIRMANRVLHLVKKLNGTVMVTSVGMFGRGAGWGIPLAGHTLCVTIGGIVSRAVVRDGQIENREHLCLTVSFDHDIVDGAPAARFVQRFKELVESGSGLFEEMYDCSPPKT